MKHFGKSSAHAYGGASYMCEKFCFIHENLNVYLRQISIQVVGSWPLPEVVPCYYYPTKVKVSSLN